MVTGNVSFVFSRCSIDIKIELNQDLVNLSQIRFEVCELYLPRKARGGGRSSSDSRRGERNQVFFFFYFRYSRPMGNKTEEISFTYGLRGECLPPFRHPSVWLFLAKSLTHAWFLLSDASLLVLLLSHPASWPRAWIWCTVGPGPPSGIMEDYPNPLNPSPGTPKWWSIHPGCSRCPLLVFSIHNDNQLRFNSSSSV